MDMHRGLQRYYNFIVNDLVTDTMLDKEMEVISTPWLVDYYFNDIYIGTMFKQYIQKKFGTKNPETHIIWDMYKIRMFEVING